MYKKENRRKQQIKKTTNNLTKESRGTNRRDTVLKDKEEKN